jgi:glycosyltransferase 2 family protein
MTAVEDPALSDVEIHPDLTMRERRVRSPIEVVRLLFGLGLLLVGILLAEVADQTLTGAEADLADGLEEIPDRVREVILGSLQIIIALVPLLGLGWLVVTRRWRLLAMFLSAAWIASLVERLLSNALLGRPLDTGDPVVEGFLGDETFPDAAFLAGSAAAITIVAPWLSRAWRRVLWLLVAVAVVLRVLAAADAALDVVAAIAVGIVVGSAMLLVFGAPSRRPDPLDVVTALRTIRLDPSRIDPGPDWGGVEHFRVTTRTGPPVLVSVRTLDDRSADLLARLYRRARLVTADGERPFSSLKQRIEHEALLMFSARRSGARVPDVLTTMPTAKGSVLLVAVDEGCASMGATIDDAAGAEVAAADQLRVLQNVWTQLATLHRQRIGHGDLSLDDIVVDAQGAAWLVNWDRGVMGAPAHRLDQDVAQLLVASATRFGIDPSLDAAIAGLGPERVAGAIPYLQPLALAGTTRRALRERRGMLRELSERARQRTGAAAVELARIERMRPRSLLMIFVLALAVYLLLPQLGDIGDTIEAARDASVPWLAVCLVASAATYVFATISFVGSVPRALALGPTFRAQVAGSFASLIAPANTGGLAVKVRFLQRSGLDTATATAATGLNAVGGLAVHIALLVVFLLWTDQSGVGGFSLPDTDLVFLLLALAVVVGGAVLVVPAGRRWVVRPLLEAVSRAVDTVSSVLTDPSRVALLVGGAAGISLAYIVALVATVEAFGGGLTVPQIGAAYLAATALASAAPTPGGLGAVEAALVAALTGFGLPSAVAISATLSFRLATYWLPLLPGWLAFTWMQRHEEI